MKWGDLETLVYQMKMHRNLLLDLKIEFDVNDQCFKLHFEHGMVGLFTYELSDLLENYYVAGRETLEEAFYTMLNDKEIENARYR